MTLISLCLFAELMSVKIDNVEFTIYQQSEPNQVVFLIGGDNADDTWWFKDLTLFKGHQDTLFIGVAQSYHLSADLEIIINYVNSNYDFANREQWSFAGFSLGAYETFSHAMLDYSDVFSNYCAIGGGSITELKANPNINYLYVCYGEYDIYATSCANIIRYLRTKGYVGYSNSKFEILPDVGHSTKEAKNGLSNFLDELDIKYSKKEMLSWLARQQRNQLLKAKTNLRSNCIVQ